MKKRFYSVIGVFFLLCCIFTNEITIKCQAEDTNESCVNRVILDADDFDTLEEYQTYLEQNPWAVSNVISNRTVQQRVKSSNQIAQHRYALNNLSHTGLPIQKTYIDGNYIYVLRYSRINYPNYNYFNTNSYMSRYYVDWNTYSAVYMDCMVLENFGHGQTLEFFSRNGQTYFWVACKDAFINEDSPRWAIQIGRMKYVPGATIRYTSIPRLSSIIHANKNGNFPLSGTIKRTDTALSPDSKTLFIWSKSTTNNMQFSFYDAEKLNKLLDAKENQSSKYIACTSEDVKKANLSSFTKAASSNILPYSNIDQASFQGADIDNKKNIYIIGGARGQLPLIHKVSSEGTVLKAITVSGTDNSNSPFPQNGEPEGIQLLGDSLYFVYYNGSYGVNSSGEIQYIYSIPVFSFN